VAILLYYGYKVMKWSRSLNVFFGILIFVIVWLFVSQIIEMKLLGSILDKVGECGRIGTHRPLPGGDTQVPAHAGLAEPCSPLPARAIGQEETRHRTYRHPATCHGMHEHE